MHVNVKLPWLVMEVSPQMYSDEEGGGGKRVDHENFLDCTTGHMVQDATVVISLDISVLYHAGWYNKI